VKPYIEPAYNSYIAPYVQVARPYADKACTNVYIPASNIATNVYKRHAEPIIAQAWRQGQKEWYARAHPYVKRYSAVLNKQYQHHVEPRIREANRVLDPWWTWARATADKQYHQVLVPASRRITPYAQRIYNQSRHYAVHYAIPTARQGAYSAVVFIKRRIWPSIYLLYGQHIEPQISKIRLRLASYTDGKKMEAVINENVEYASEKIDSMTVQPVSLEDLLIPVTSTATSVLPTISSTLSQATSSVSSTLLPTATSSPSTTHTPQETVVSNPTSTAKDIISPTTIRTTSSTTDPASAYQPSDDISKWNAKFTRAAEQGSTDLESRIGDILSRQLNSQVKGVGSALLTQLEVEAEEGLSNVKDSIVKAVASLPEESGNDHKAEALHDILETLRASAKIVKDRAQQVREWKSNYDVETMSMIASATESTMSVLDGIRDLGLQKIGMRWAELEDVTYQDWTSYHQLKRNFDQLRSDMLKSATSTGDQTDAMAEASNVLNSAMNIAGDVASELSRLKDVAKWKIESHDASDDFSTRYATVAAAKGFGQKIAVMFGTEEEAVSTDSIGLVDDINSLASEATQSVIGTLSQLSETIATAVESATDIGTSSPESTIDIISTVTDPAIEIARSIEDFYSTATDSVASAVRETSSVVSEAVATSTTKIAAEPLLLAGSVPVPSQLFEGITEEVDVGEVPADVEQELSSSISSSALYTVSSAASVASEYGNGMSGTMLPSASAIIEDKESTDIVDGARQASASLQSKFNGAGDGLADMTRSLASAAKASASSLSRPMSV
jgi:hypothetical protein